MFQRFISFSDYMRFHFVVQNLVSVVQISYICTTKLKPKLRRMATIKAIIRTTKKSGTANIRFRVSDGRSVQLWHVSDIEVDVSLWDNSKERINTKKVCSTEYRRKIDSRVNERRQLVADVYEANKDSIASSSEFERLIYDTLNPKTKKTQEIGFFGAFEKFVENRGIYGAELKCYRTLERLLFRYQEYRKYKYDRKFLLSIYKADSELIEDITDYIRNEIDLLNEDKNFSERVLAKYPLLPHIQRKTTQLGVRGDNTISKYQKRLKAFFNWLCAEGIIQNNPFIGVKVKAQKYGTPYYITIAEREAIYQHDFSNNKPLERQRDIFVFQCLIGCRVGDLLRMRLSNVVGDSIQYIPHKTMKEKPQTITVPLHPIAKKILAKYKTGDDDSPLLPFISAQKYNEAIKDIFRVCGITRMVTILNPKTGEPQQVPINEVASSHLARRTFVGNLYKQVKDPNLIGKLSGHSEGSRAFARYRDIDEEMKKELINLL